MQSLRNEAQAYSLLRDGKKTMPNERHPHDSILALKEGGGIAFIREDEEVTLLSIIPGIDQDAALPVVGRCSIVHLEYVAKQILMSAAQWRKETGQADPDVSLPDEGSSGFSP